MIVTPSTSDDVIVTSSLARSDLRGQTQVRPLRSDKFPPSPSQVHHRPPSSEKRGVVIQSTFCWPEIWSERIGPSFGPSVKLKRSYVQTAQMAIQGDLSDMQQYLVDFNLEFHLVANISCQFCHICSCPSRIGQAAKITNQRQQNSAADLMGHPVLWAQNNGRRDFESVLNCHSAFSQRNGGEWSEVCKKGAECLFPR